MPASSVTSRKRASGICARSSASETGVLARPTRPLSGLRRAYHTTAAAKTARAMRATRDHLKARPTMRSSADFEAGSGGISRLRGRDGLGLRRDVDFAVAQVRDDHVDRALDRAE